MPPDHWLGECLLASHFANVIRISRQERQPGGGAAGWRADGGTQGEGEGPTNELEVRVLAPSPQGNAPARYGRRRESLHLLSGIGGCPRRQPRCPGSGRRGEACRGRLRGQYTAAGGGQLSRTGRSPHTCRPQRARAEIVYLSRSQAR